MDRKEYLSRYNKLRYQDPEYREQLRLSNKQCRDRTRDWLKAYKATLSCIVCGEKHPACLDFHHIDPSNKDRAVRSRKNWGIERLKKEISKCKVLCDNCHRKCHFSGELV